MVDLVAAELSHSESSSGGLWICESQVAAFAKLQPPSPSCSLRHDSGFLHGGSLPYANVR